MVCCAHHSFSVADAGDTWSLGIHAFRGCGRSRDGIRRVSNRQTRVSTGLLSACGVFAERRTTEEKDYSLGLLVSCVWAAVQRRAAYAGRRISNLAFGRLWRRSLLPRNRGGLYSLVAVSAAIRSQGGGLGPPAHCCILVLHCACLEEMLQKAITAKALRWLFFFFFAAGGRTLM